MPVFVEEPDSEIALPVFADKRYGTFRKQMVTAAVVIVVGAAIFSILFVYFPIFEEPEEAAAPDTIAQGLRAEQAREVQLETLRKQLREFLASGNWPAVRQLADAIREIDPADGETWSYVAMLHEQSGQLAEAREAYGRAIDAKYMPSFALLRRAMIERQLGNYTAAIVDLQESARLDPQSVAVPNLILICQIESGDAETVRKAVEALDAAGLDSAAGQYLLGKAALDLHDGEPARAAAILTRFQAMTPPEIFAELIQDPFFASYRNEAELLPFFLKN